MDGATGLDNPNNSFNLLYDWMTTEGNYAQFWGNKEERTKLAFCEEVINMLKEMGVMMQCSSKNMSNMIQGMEKAFKLAYN